MAKYKLKRGDTVEVIAGKNKGRRGTIREIRPDSQRVIVADGNIVKKHIKPGRQGARPAGIVEIEAPIHTSNVALVDPKTDQPQRGGLPTRPDEAPGRVA